MYQKSSLRYVGVGDRSNSSNIYTVLICNMIICIKHLPQIVVVVSLVSKQHQLLPCLVGQVLGGSSTAPLPALKLPTLAHQPGRTVASQQTQRSDRYAGLSGSIGTGAGTPRAVSFLLREWTF